MVPTSSKPAINAAESPTLARFLSWIKPKASHRSISCINGGSSSLLSASHLAMCFIFTCAFQLSRRGRGKGGSACCIRACCFETLSHMLRFRPIFVHCPCTISYVRRGAFSCRGEKERLRGRGKVSTMIIPKLRQSFLSRLPSSFDRTLSSSALLIRMLPW